MAEIPGSNPGEPIMGVGMSEEKRLFQHELEKVRTSLEDIQEMKLYILDEPISHYRCSYASQDNPLVFVWEEGHGEGDDAARIDYIGCLQCGVMTQPENVVGGTDNYRAYNVLND